ncbi:MAG TPA: MotA/TolQ/ExbB proton channel family protein [bacterium]|nr:MotA/TolQ/ExbB proton channel family protein [bacterium]
MLSDFNWIEAVGTSPVFVVLIGCSIATVAVAIERLVYFWKRNGNADATLERALADVRRGDIREATRTCESSRHPMGPVTTTLFRDGEYLEEGSDERLQIALSQQKMLLERNLGVLGTMAAVAPLIGLLGTVWGIMRAFHDMARVGSAAPAVVASGVAEALVTTAAGLVVAVPAVMLYNHLTRKLNGMLIVAENHARSVRATLTEPAVLAAAAERAPKKRETAAAR